MIVSTRTLFNDNFYLKRHKNLKYSWQAFLGNPKPAVWQWPPS